MLEYSKGELVIVVDKNIYITESNGSYRSIGEINYTIAKISACTSVLSGFAYMIQNPFVSAFEAAYITKNQIAKLSKLGKILYG